MKRMLFAVCTMLAALSLSGCMEALKSLSGNGPMAQARRTRYLQAHPDDPYAQQILNGQLARGMSTDDLQAVYGSMCGYSSESSLGTFYECHLDVLNNDRTMMVLVDNDGKVASWIE
ncbi:MAG: hypothetical protein KGH75_10605 [Rhodospirillales bacterium]|nr:hypothetical protein [Rhodospirillales bacterium]